MSKFCADEGGSDARWVSAAKGLRLVCALDEQTCVVCLEHDGGAPPGPLPLHDGCRCVVVPAPVDDSELHIHRSSSTALSRSSSIGPVPEDGGLYKKYLLARARGAQGALVGVALAQHLRQWLDSQAAGVAAEPEVGASVRAALLELDGAVSNAELMEIAGAIPWPTPHSSVVFAACITRGLYDTVEECLQRLSKCVPDGPYAGRHRASLYRVAAQCMSDAAPDRARAHLVQAVELDGENTAVHIELAKFLRQQGDLAGARASVERVLEVSPGHKGGRFYYWQENGKWLRSCSFILSASQECFYVRQRAALRSHHQ